MSARTKFNIAIVLVVSVMVLLGIILDWAGTCSLTDYRTWLGLSAAALCICTMIRISGMAQHYEYEEKDNQAYCVKCRAMREMRRVKRITMANGKPARQGVCPVCKTKMFRILRSKPSLRI